MRDLAGTLLHSEGDGWKRVCKDTSPAVYPTALPQPEKMAQPPVQAELNARKSVPRAINVDKNAAYPKALAEIKACGMLSTSVELRQVMFFVFLFGFLRHNLSQ